jgi:hypothetical protein
MTTVTITHADVGMTVAQNGVLSALRYLVADRATYQVFRLVDDAPPHDVVPKSLFCSDMLTQATNNNGALQSPFGVCIQNATIAFGNLTVAACPTDSVFAVDCTGALAAPIPAASVPHSGHVAHLARQQAALVQAHAARVAADRDKTPPTSLELTPNAAKPEPPPPPDPELVAAEQRANELVAAERAARAAAKGPTIVGPPLEQVRTELRQAVLERQHAYAVVQDKLQAMAAKAVQEEA